MNKRIHSILAINYYYYRVLDLKFGISKTGFYIPLAEEN